MYINWEFHILEHREKKLFKNGEEKMKRKNYVILGLVLALTLAAGFGVGRVYAGGGGGVGCFTDTNGNYAETAICWLFNNGITSGTTPTTYSPNSPVTRAQVAVFLQKIATFGETYISAGLSAWHPNTNTPNAFIDYSASAANLFPKAVGTHYYQASIPIQSAVHSQQMTIKGAELCYDATHSSLGSVALYLTLPGGVSQGTVFDLTAHSDNTCRTYYYPSPIPLTSRETLTMVVTVASADTNDYVLIYSLTAIEGVTTNQAILGSPAISNNELEALPSGFAPTLP